jgi:hypothetical protein
MSVSQASSRWRSNRGISLGGRSRRLAYIDLTTSSPDVSWSILKEVQDRTPSTPWTHEKESELCYDRGQSGLCQGVGGGRVPALLGSASSSIENRIGNFQSRIMTEFPHSGRDPVIIVE